MQYAYQHWIDVDNEQFAGQLVGRLSKFKDPEIVRVVKCARTWRGSPWLCPLAPSLRPPNTILFRTLIGHKSPVKAVAINEDGTRAVSGDENGVIKIWDLNDGRTLNTFDFHSNHGGTYFAAGEVISVALSADGRWALSLAPKPYGFSMEFG